MSMLYTAISMHEITWKQLLGTGRYSWQDNNSITIWYHNVKQADAVVADILNSGNVAVIIKIDSNAIQILDNHINYITAVTKPIMITRSNICSVTEPLSLL